MYLSMISSTHNRTFNNSDNDHHTHLSTNITNHRASSGFKGTATGCR